MSKKDLEIVIDKSLDIFLDTDWKFVFWFFVYYTMCITGVILLIKGIFNL